MSQAASLQSPLLTESGFAHAFFTRIGGVSLGPFESLNFSVSGGDSLQNVEQNLARAAALLGLAPERIYFLHQVHSAAGLVVDASSRPQAGQDQAGDAVLSRDPQVGCAVRVADCAPVLIADRKNGAVAAVHSGWRGTVQNIVACSIASLRELTGNPGELIAAVGPHIEACCFEVGQDVAQSIASCSGARDVVLARPGKNPHVDLRKVIEAQLRACGVVQVEHVRGCTQCDAKRFYSYRRDGKISGRHLCAIVPRSP